MRGLPFLFVIALAVFFVMCGIQSFANPDVETLTDLSLRQLCDMQVTSVSRKPESLSDAGAAVFVITQEDIRRSGALSIPDLLRMAPGVEVARANLNDSYVTIRGFNEETENKLLVLIDGRSVYSPMYSGVFWYEQDLVLEDIERIEVIRGPGATMWGANAVNGVINIITKHTKDRQGTLVSGGGGTAERVFGTVRHGAKVGEHGYGAIWFKAFDRDQLNKNHNANTRIPRGWESVLTGFRYDWDPPTPHAFVLESQWRETQTDDKFLTFTPDPPARGPVIYRRLVTLFNVLGKYTRRFSETSEGSLQLYYDSNHNDWGNSDIRYETYDADSQVRFQVGEWHDIVCGAGFRRVEDSLKARHQYDGGRFSPEEAQRDLVHFFLEDEITLIPMSLSIKPGCKFEHNEYTGWETQPSVRLHFNPCPGHTIWAGISRAARIPSRIDADGSATPSFPGSFLPPHLQKEGSVAQLDIRESDPQSEVLTAYELGYRAQPTTTFWFDMAFYYNDFKHLRSYGDLSGGYQPTEDPLRYLWVMTPDNGKDGRVYGAEFSASWQCLQNLWLIPAYSYMDLEMETAAGSFNLLGITTVEGLSPEQQASLRIQWTPARNLECDLWVRYVGALDAENIDAYTTCDARVAWRPSSKVEVALVGQNLAEEWHQEFRFFEVERSVYLKLSCSF